MALSFLFLLAAVTCVARGSPSIVDDITGGGITAPPRVYGPLRLTAEILNIVETNPRNTEGIFNRIVRYLDERHSRYYPDTLVTLQAGRGNPPAEREINKPFVRDAFKVMTDGTVLDGYVIKDTIFDTLYRKEYDRLIAQANAVIRRNNQRLATPVPELPGYKGLPHRDAFQLIPNWRVNFAGGVLSNVVISNNVITSPGYLQAIFASDGAFRNLRITGNRIQTGSPHQITIAGMLSGVIVGNTDLEYRPLHSVTLLPMRLGGGHNVFVLSFHPASGYAYDRVAGIHPDQDQRRIVHKIAKHNAKYLVDFRMDLFAAAYERESAARPLGGQARAELAATLALKYGRLHQQ